VRATVTINAQGRMTVPAEIRRELGITPDSVLIVETEGGRMIVRPAAVVPAEDLWAYTPEHRALHAGAIADVRAGRVMRLTEAGLRARLGLDAGDDEEAPDGGRPRRTGRAR
jgi:AbrB family looped-hinge helix DNA binding protein